MKKSQLRQLIREEIRNLIEKKSSDYTSPTDKKASRGQVYALVDGGSIKGLFKHQDFITDTMRFGKHSSHGGSLEKLSSSASIQLYSTSKLPTKSKTWGNIKDFEGQPFIYDRRKARDWRGRGRGLAFVVEKKGKAVYISDDVYEVEDAMKKLSGEKEPNARGEYGDYHVRMFDVDSDHDGEPKNVTKLTSAYGGGLR